MVTERQSGLAEGWLCVERKGSQGWSVRGSSRKCLAVKDCLVAYWKGGQGGSRQSRKATVRIGSFSPGSHGELCQVEGGLDWTGLAVLERLAKEGLAPVGLVGNVGERQSRNGVP